MSECLIMLDSGAFSAFSGGAIINLSDYISFIKTNEKFIDFYINLDVIGDQEACWKNQETMEKEGLNPLPVYHIQDDLSYLEKCMSYNYFCIGGMAVGFTTEQRLVFFDRCFSIICNNPQGIPTHKVHGLGMTSLQLMLRYPWYSVDSTSWVLTGRFGSVYVPKKRNGVYLYDENTWKVGVSNRSPRVKEEGRHFNSFTEMEQNHIREYFSEKGYVLGKSELHLEDRMYRLKEEERWFGKVDTSGNREVETIIENGLCNDYRKRDELNIIYFLDLEKYIQPWPWAFKLKESRKGFGLK